MKRATGPPKKERALCGSALRKLIALTEYATLSLVANISGAVFWFVEQRRWVLADRIEEEETR